MVKFACGLLRGCNCIALLFLFGLVGQVKGQEFLLFEQEQPATTVFGWDFFSGFYPQPHANSIGPATAELVVTPAGGLVSSTMNLYSFFTVPTFQFSLTELDDSLPLTSVVIQFATTGVVDGSSFEVPPDQFLDLGIRSTLGFDGDSLDVNYYWAQWRGLPAAESFEFRFDDNALHVSFCAARIAYINASTEVDIRFAGDVLLGDINCDGSLDLLDVSPFVDLLAGGEYSDKADMNQDGVVDLLDISLFVSAIVG